MQFNGIIMGVAIFFIIGVFHPIVIKAEYFFTKKIWPVFLITGLIFVLISLFCENDMISILLGVLGFTCFWSIKEIFEQEERVKKGWFPKNPKRK
ncbi:MAG: DUF4491 family protein [Clostridium butyricum]|nr:DUF4491 family protein [Clostridium butyricum]